MNVRKLIVLSVAVLLLVLAGAAFANWGEPAISWALPQQQTQQGQQVASSVPAALSQQEIAGIAPTQEVLSGLYEQVAPSVVNIQVTVEPSMTDLPFGFPFGIPEDQIPQQRGQGSGFVYDNEGHIVTNNHVVENATDITVYFYNGMWAEAELVATDPQSDLAVLQVTPPEGVTLQPLPLAGADTLRVGYYVIAVGSPFGLSETMTTGIVSALGRSFPTGDPIVSGGYYSLPDVIQTDAAINPGNSGGPLLNLAGEVVGVNFAINTTSGSNSGVGFAIPVSVVQKVVPALIQDGSYAYSYLGISGQTIDATVAEEADLPENTLGVWVAEVVRGGPAAEGGVESGDIVVSIDDETVTRFEDLTSYLFQSTTPGQTVTLGLLRDGERQDVEVTLGERPRALQEEGERGFPTRISIAEAIGIAREAVQDAGLMEEIESARATQESTDGRVVWVVTLTGGGNTAAVTVDAQTGEVLDLTVE